MTKLTGAALDRAVAHAIGVKSVHNCEKWGEHMSRIEEDDDIQDYVRPWVGLTDEEIKLLANLSDETKILMTGRMWIFVGDLMDKIKEKNT